MARDGSVCVQVASSLRKSLCQHMKAYLDKTEAVPDEHVRIRHAGCKMLLPTLGEA